VIFFDRAAAPSPAAWELTVLPRPQLDLYKGRVEEIGKEEGEAGINEGREAKEKGERNRKRNYLP